MFVENNTGFICSVCGTEVAPHPTSSRNHCTQCLSSVHVDNEPGDRKNECKGIMEPIGLETKEGKTQIVFSCKRCGKQGKNIVAIDDNSEMLVQLSTKIWKTR